MIKIFEEDDEEIGHLVELYSDDDGKYTSFAEPFITDLDTLKLVLLDVERDGLNRYFFKTGKFFWDDCNNLGYTSDKDKEDV